jgi:catechol 2,3-dioxygenase-like lactoylglutathione lyase family enzyme
MEFTGLHHITMFTGDAQENARFYGDLLGLRLVRNTVNFDQPRAYQLYDNDDRGAGSVHHFAWAADDDDHVKWQERIAEAGGFVTDVRDRDYFKSIYFRIPSGVLFAIATLSPVNKPRVLA